MTSSLGIPIWRYVRVVAPTILLWHLVSIVVDNQVIVPSPVLVADALISAVADGSMGDAVVASLRRLGIGYGLALLTCLPVGIAMGLSDTARMLVDPVIEVLRPISGIAWIPLALLIFGVGDSLVVFIIFYGAAFPMLVNTVAGVRQVDRHFIQVARTLGASRLSVLAHVTLPAALPTILVGLRVAAGTAWMSLVAAELVGSETGLGFSLEYFRQLLMAPRMIASVVVIGLLGLLCNVLLLALQRAIIPWAEAQS